MRALLTLCLFALGSAAAAQDLTGRADGLFGSAIDPATSCAANPHRMEFETQPPHLNLIWEAEKDGPWGQPRSHERYDLEHWDESSMFLREEGDYRPDPEGQGRFWVLQFTQTPDGYCWRRPDWPEVRCEDQQLRCENATS